MLEFQLFRIKVFPSKQLSLLESPKSHSEILHETIRSSPSVELRKGMNWHIGNIVSIDNNGLYFRVGRTTKSTLEVYKDGNFTDTEFETSPYTHVLVDLDLEICAIAKKMRLSPKTTGIANQFIRLLNESEMAKTLSSEFTIQPLTDPEDFISHLKKAHTIAKFWITFTKPNAFDVEDDFIKPAQKLIQESNGKLGKTQIEGTKLNAEVLEELSRSAAATGDDAAAWLQPTPTENITKKQLKGNPVIITEDEIEIQEKKEGLLGRIRRLYEKIRGKD